ncbi:hypothetical protein UlMin_020143 [Ulmus minor]
MRMTSLRKPLQLLSIPSNAKNAIVAFSSSSLSHEELNKINLLLPRLCLSDHLTTAIQLTTTALLTNPPPNSLSLSILTHSLASQPDMTLPMSLLTRLLRTPHSHRHLAPIATTLAASYFKMGKPKEALKVFKWMVRPGSPFKLDDKVCGVLVKGFCRNAMVVEALKVLRAMAAANVAPCGGLKMVVCRGLLKEAKIREAVELNGALDRVRDGDGDEGLNKKLLEVLDRIIENWME